jgi:hypothetical protein
MMWSRSGLYLLGFGIAALPFYGVYRNRKTKRIAGREFTAGSGGPV